VLTWRDKFQSNLWANPRAWMIIALENTVKNVKKNN
jgi:hypothetical protein